jgi:hypothetical protein
VALGSTARHQTPVPAAIPELEPAQPGPEGVAVVAVEDDDDVDVDVVVEDVGVSKASEDDDEADGNFVVDFVVDEVSRRVRVLPGVAC